MTLPYENATTGRRAIDDIRKILLSFGCSKFAPMEDFDRGLVTIQFEWRGRMVSLEASGEGYAQAFLKEHPYNSRMLRSLCEYEQFARKRGAIAVWSILRDWVKGQITAVETGILSFEAAFLGQMVMPSGDTVLKTIQKQGMLPQLEKKQ